MVMAVWKYGEDLTGANPDNLVSGEIHTVPLENKYAFATDYGPFYSDSVVVTVKDTGVELVRGVDYECLYLYSDATQKSGKPVTAVIHILNKSINADLLVDYQVVGGPYSSNAYALEELIALLQIDNRAIAWENISNKPLTFPPAPHLHAATDLYGLEWMVDAINELTSAVLLGDTASHDQIYLRIQTVKKQLQDNIDANALADKLRMDQIQADMEAMDTRLTGQINALSSVVSAHINNKNNPHQVTTTQIDAVPITRTVNGKALTQNIVLSAADVSAYSKTEMDAKVVALQNADAQLQTNINAVQANLNSHTANRSNPHGVTSAQSNSVPTSRTINGKALTGNITITAADVGTYDMATINNMIANAGITSMRWGGLNTLTKTQFQRWSGRVRTGVITTIPAGGVCVQMLDARIDSDWYLRDIDGVDWRYLQMARNGTWYNVGL